MNSGGTVPDPEEQRAADLAADTRRIADALAEATEEKAEQLAGALEATLTGITGRLEELGRSLDSVSRRLQVVAATSRRTRHLAIGLTVSFVLDIVLTVVLGYTAVTAHGTADTNTQLVQELHAQQVALHAEQLASCANGNTFRADQDVIWQDFIALVAKPSPGEPAAQVTKTDKLASQFLAYVTTVNHPINCTVLYGK